ncbi:hypothetical protein [Natrononativus amylolyticus]|uniref:hypothetical protein n=1 Tax=Natrononativus amylolyticus TaxID=2963434 RepID=UPI0020CC6E32|nr:hypothetical protein [Natrononativus amylolyticus]
MTVRLRLRTIALTELRRRWRSLKSNTGQLIAIAFVVVMSMAFSIAGLAGLYFFGAAIADGSVETPLEWVRMAFVYAWIGIAAFGGYRAYAIALRPDNVDGLLTTVSHREVIGGLLLAELLLWSVPAVLVGTVGATAFAVGLQSLVVVPLALATVCAVITTALVTGFVAALVVRNSGVRSRLLTRLRTVFFVILGLAYVGLIVTQNFASVLDPLFRLLSPTPVGWFGDLATVWSPVGGSSLRAGGALLASVAWLLVAAPVLSRLAAWLWYADGVSVEHERPASQPTAERSRLDGLVPAPLLGVIHADWKRARRAPITLSFSLYPLIVLVGPVTTTVQTGEVGGTLPLWVTLCGAWIAGSLFSLNVLGTQGATLPVTLLGTGPGRALVGGHALAGVLLCTPVTVATVIGLGIVSPLSTGTLAVLGVAALVLCVSAGFIASGIGTVFPRFEAVSVSRSTKAIVPSTIAFGVYSLVLVVVALPVILGSSTVVGHWVASVFDVSTLAVSVVGLALTTALAVGAGGASAFLSIRHVESYRLG